MVGDILQPTHLLLVLVVALLVLGPKRLPEVGRQLGRGLRDFRAAINGERTDTHEDLQSGYPASTGEPAVHPAAPTPAAPEPAGESATSAAEPARPAAERVPPLT